MEVRRVLCKVPDKDKCTDFSSVLQAIPGNLGSTPCHSVSFIFN